MKRAIFAAVAADLAAPAAAQTPEPSPPPAPTDQRGERSSPEQGEQEPRPAEQEARNQEIQNPDAATPQATPAPQPEGEEEEAKWDVNAPPGDWRDIPIDVTEGTWMSLDVSPDGREIVFDLLGDLYVMPIEGGEARNIASGIAWDMQPKYSPDGRSIAFTSDRGGGDNIWIIDRDGSNPRQVSKETFRLVTQPDWTPDGQFVVGRKHFTSSRSLGAGEMWLYHRSGGGGVQLTERRTQQKDTGEPAG